jgi:hypothetical protein
VEEKLTALCIEVASSDPERWVSNLRNEESMGREGRVTGNG